MDKLLRALIRACVVGFVFASLAVGLAFTAHDRPSPSASEALLAFVLVLFVTSLVVGPLSAVELIGAEREPSVARDVIAGALGLVLGTAGVAAALIQATYLQAMLERRGFVAALDEVRKLLHAMGEHPEGFRVVAAFAVPFVFVTVGRMRRVRAIIETPVTVFTSVGIAGLLFTGTDVQPIVWGFVGAAAGALSVGTRLADLIATKIAARLEREEAV
jgi:hypothetical protein